MSIISSQLLFIVSLQGLLLVQGFPLAGIY